MTEVPAENPALDYARLAEAKASIVPEEIANAPTIPVDTAGVIGAGTMGGGIAINFLNAGIPVMLVDSSREALDRGIANIRGKYESSARRGKMTAEQVERRMALLTPSLDLGDLANVDLIIEAVFEEMSIKTDIFSRLDAIAKPGAILASNTSYLDIDTIAAATRRPESVVGLHFFSPANIMRLLEIVRTRHSADAVIATAMQLAVRIGKVPVLSRVCHGFIANRIMSQRRIQAEALVLTVPSPSDIDRVLRDYGFAMGPFQMADLVGLDVIGRGGDVRTLRGDFVDNGRLGQKNKVGFYDYDADGKPTPSPVAAALIADFAAHSGVTEKKAQSDEDILFRLLLPIVNEGAHVLEEGIALRASDIDVAALLGYNWPKSRGGPMYWADEIGLPLVVSKLEELAARHGEPFIPAPLLRRFATEGRRLSDG